jgi:hypothetical protein
MKTKEGAMTNPDGALIFPQGISLPEPVVLHAIVSWHLIRIGVATHKSEAIFHWRQIKYYRNYWQEVICQPGDPWPNEREMIEQLRTTGMCTELIKAIDHHGLLEVE